MNSLPSSICDVSIADLGLDEARVTVLSSCGTPYTRTVRFGVPKLPASIVNAAVFLYEDETSARAGADAGGSGFIVSVTYSCPETLAFSATFYVVTNWHVACAGGFSVVRVNRREGGSDIFTFDPSEWSFLPQYDIAVVPINLDLAHHNYASISASMFLTEDQRKLKAIGPGDDVFMVGRFVDVHNGQETNRPSLRFGNISLNPVQVPQPNQKDALCYCLDMRSRSGYSGSPVFVYRTPGNDLSVRKVIRSTDEFVRYLAGGYHLSLLGIHVGQFWEPLKSKSGVDLEGLSGMTIALPASAISEVLNMPKLKKEREEKASIAPRSIAEAAKTEDGGDAVLRKMLNTPPKTAE